MKNHLATYVGSAKENGGMWTSARVANDVAKNIIGWSFTMISLKNESRKFGLQVSEIRHLAVYKQGLIKIICEQRKELRYIYLTKMPPNAYMKLNHHSQFLHIILSHIWNSLFSFLVQLSLYLCNLILLTFLEASECWRWYRMEGMVFIRLWISLHF